MIMNEKKYLENKLQKKYPHIFLTDIKPLNPFDIVKRSNVSNSPVKDLFMLDFQSLLCQIHCSHFYNSWPRWCRLNKPQNIASVHVIVVEGLSAYNWSECLINYGESKSFKKYFEIINKKLDRNIRFVNPISYGISWKSELFEIPSNFIATAFRLSKKFGVDVKSCKKVQKSLKRKFRKCGDLDQPDIVLLREKFNLNIDAQEIEDNITTKEKKDKFPRTQLLMNIEQMENENIPREGQGNKRWEDFKYSIPSGYKNVTDSSPIFAVDCEMVECLDTSNDKVTKNLASVSIINEDRVIVYHKYVRPPHLIVNYLTPYSGITPDIIEGTSTTLETVQEDLVKIIPQDAILVGHSVGNDLEALKLFHPYLIDTSVIYNLKGLRGVKSKLKVLSMLFLNREIQSHKAQGHDSLEDALATMDLILLKLSKTVEYGDATVEEESDEEDDSVSTKEEQSKESLPITITTTNPTHLRHRELLNESKKSDDSINLLKSLLPSLQTPFKIDTVATVNNIEGFSNSWFPEEFKEFLIRQKEEETRMEKEPLNKRPRRKHPLKVSQVSCKSLTDSELPSKKWITKLLKKVIKEFDNLPVHSLCALMFTDGECDSAHGDSAFGRLYFGLTSPVISDTEI